MSIREYIMFGPEIKPAHKMLDIHYRSRYRIPYTNV
jgi:hypothetical protein